MNIVIGKCPKCSNNIIETVRGYSCEDKEGCGFHLNYYNLAGLGIPFVKKNIIKQLLKNPDTVIELKARESGNFYKKKAWLYKGEGYTAWTIVVADDFHNELLGACPACNSAVLEFPKAFSCSSDSCDFKIWKNYYGNEVSFEMALGLLAGETYELDCVSPRNKQRKWREAIWLEHNILMNEKL